jgi:hypothetical protein
MEQDTSTPEVAEATEAQAPAPVNLTLQDLRVVAGAIELGAQRGGYRAGEMEVIGATYNKLAAFLAANQPAPAPAETAETAEAAEVTEDSTAE